MGMAIGGAFLKPVIPATVRRHAPAERRAMGFSLFYASVNAGSVVGKVATKIVRQLVSLRASMINAVVACVGGIALTLGAYREPTCETGVREEPEARATMAHSTLRDLITALTQGRFVVFLVLIAGYYLLIEQFYQTFPTYIVRSFGEDAPREYITLINPAVI